uniref:PSI subunit V n=1 Tax=Ananas comosus var. bracteatus TaxID=296719 RepID=A0A6V7Q0Y1_ANACO|nr:unnamed protein product [Ananas comosus var. bracteatus]
MATAPMASQLRSSFLSPTTTTTTTTTSSRVLVTPRGISGNPLRDLHSRRRSSLTVRAVVPEKQTYQVIQPINGDPFIGSLETPITSSPLIAWYLSNLPAYRTAVSPLLRGVEVGLAHGYLLVGPFVITGPLRNTPTPAGRLARRCRPRRHPQHLPDNVRHRVVQGGEPSVAPSLTLTGRKKEADKLQTAEGWASSLAGSSSAAFRGLSGPTSSSTSSTSPLH